MQLPNGATSRLATIWCALAFELVLHLSRVDHDIALASQSLGVPIESCAQIFA
jgi:hypothetical protein